MIFPSCLGSLDRSPIRNLLLTLVGKSVARGEGSTGARDPLLLKPWISPSVSCSVIEGVSQTVSQPAK